MSLHAQKWSDISNDWSDLHNNLIFDILVPYYGHYRGCGYRKKSLQLLSLDKFIEDSEH